MTFSSLPGYLKERQSLLNLIQWKKPSGSKRIKMCGNSSLSENTVPEAALLTSQQVSEEKERLVAGVLRYVRAGHDSTRSKVMTQMTQNFNTVIHRRIQKTIPPMGLFRNGWLCITAKF